MKMCSTCGLVKAHAHFAVRRAASDGLQSQCRGCFRDWYERNKTTARASIDRRQALVRATNRALLAEYFAAHPCVDCEETDIRVLDFDHRDDVHKRCNVARLLGGGISWEAIVAEIAKCDVRCANCHRRRTCERGGWWRQGVFEESARVAAVNAAARMARIFNVA